MSLEFRPAGVACNLTCRYCYEQPTRDAGHTVRYDRDAVLKALETSNGYWSLFGGEALLVGPKAIEELLALSHKRFGRSSVQTNGSLVTDEFVDLFTRYNTHVGFSIDGPDDLNDIRWAGTEDATRRATAKSLAALYKLLDMANEGKAQRPSMILTVHAGNIGTPDRQDRLLRWFEELDLRGLQSINLHVMELDFEAAQWSTDTDTAVAFLTRLWDLEHGYKHLRFGMFREILTLLRGKDENVKCVWHACDPWNTQAVEGLEGDGTPSGCTRINKDGLTWLPAHGTGAPTKHAIGGYAASRYHERQLSLYVTPQEHGGCGGCRYWLMCKGQCPGTGESSQAQHQEQGDWRYRTSYCALWKRLFDEGERRLLAVGEQPLSRSPRRLKLEEQLYRTWVDSGNMQLTPLVHGAPQQNGSNLHQDMPHGDLHGDHDDLALLQVVAEPDHHGDVPHGDTHGDHDDL